MRARSGPIFDDAAGVDVSGGRDHSFRVEMEKVQIAPSGVQGSLRL